MKKNKIFSVLGLMGIILALGISTGCSRDKQVKSELPWRPVEGRLKTRWAKNITPENVLQEYPRPQMKRKEWLNLNGLWEYALCQVSNKQPDEYEGGILVPFPVESALSGVGKPVGKEKRLWYRRFFEVPRRWKRRHILLNFEAVDWEATVWVNGKKMGTHKGGYDPFSFDITSALKKRGSQQLVVSVWDPTDEGTQPRGKQVMKPRGIWYTAVTGIWQTVWLEPAAETHISALRIIPDIDSEEVRIKTICSDKVPAWMVELEVLDGNKPFALSGSKAGIDVGVPIRNAKLWSPDSPFLYTLKVRLKDSTGSIVDEIESYFGMRKISLGKDNAGITRLFLNNHALFQFGPLDQGWWPDGLYTAPTDAALRYDIEVTKELGMNMLRKHVKIEPRRFYYWCDKLGVMVWQDMPSGDKYIGRKDEDITRSQESDKQFQFELQRLIDTRYNHPAIVMWVPFNEGWGQYKTAWISGWIKGYDPSRLVDNASGWKDRQVGDVHDIHAYPGPAAPPNEELRAAVLGEFGGLGLPVPGHNWQEEKNWGYRSFKSAEELTAAYLELLVKLEPMIEKGLSAAVYTQTTDVEIEVNGLMTYDRELIKMDKDRAAEANRKLVNRRKN